MKKFYFLFTFLIASSICFGQTTIDFDTASNWFLNGSGYKSQTYTDGDFLMETNLSLRETSGTQNGFPSTIGTYAVRLRNDSGSEFVATIASGGVQDFTVEIRRWDGSPSPDFDMEYSTDGTSWNLITTINNASLDNSSAYKTFGGNIASDAANIKIRIKANGSTERIMIDNFRWAEFGNNVLNVAKQNIENFSTYPNPVVNGEFMINTANNSVKDVQIYDMLGKQVYAQKIEASQSVDVSNLNTGIYILKVLEEGKTATRKLVIK